MNSANLTPSNKYKSDSSQDAVDQTLRQIDAITAELKKTVKETASESESFDHTERSVREAVRKMGFQAMELFIRLQGDGDLGQAVTTEDSRTLRRSGKADRTTIRSIFGIHRFNQFTDAAVAKQAIELRPVSARIAADPNHASSRRRLRHHDPTRPGRILGTGFPGAWIPCEELPGEALRDPRRRASASGIRRSSGPA